MCERNHFMAQVAELLFVTSPKQLGDYTAYKGLDEWNVVWAVSLVLMIEREYQVQLDRIDFVETTTLGELYMRVLQLYKI